MFTGLVEEIGQVRKTVPLDEVLELTIGCSKVTDDVNVGDSIAINGVCLTVVRFTKDSFTVQAVRETKQRTTLSSLVSGSKVNLERALKAEDRLGGHFVLGHVDCLGIIRSMDKKRGDTILAVEVPVEYQKYLVGKGSVAVDGISLTIADTRGSQFTCAIIPHTMEQTNLQYKRPGDQVNIECDILGKYTEKLIGKEGKQSKITEEWLREKGF
jgi:riboflavin synthase